MYFLSHAERCWRWRWVSTIAGGVRLLLLVLGVEAGGCAKGAPCVPSRRRRRPNEFSRGGRLHTSEKGDAPSIQRSGPGGRGEEAATLITKGRSDFSPDNRPASSLASRPRDAAAEVGLRQKSSCMEEWGLPFGAIRRPRKDEKNLQGTHTA